MEVPVGKIVAAEYVSVDGIMQDPGGVGEIEAGGWTNPYWNDELAKLQTDLLFASDALLLGRVTYEGFAAAWPDMEHEEGPFAGKMNAMPKYVASRTLTDMAWNAALIEGKVAEEVARLKRDSGQNLLTTAVVTRAIAVAAWSHRPVAAHDLSRRARRGQAALHPDRWQEGTATRGRDGHQRGRGGR
jgi:dihydrofolate reductase